MSAMQAVLCLISFGSLIVDLKKWFYFVFYSAVRIAKQQLFELLCKSNNFSKKYTISSFFSHKNVAK